MKMLFITTIFFLTAAFAKNGKSTTDIIMQKQVCDTVPYPPSNKQPVEQNPVNGNGTPLNNTNPQPVLRSDTLPRVDTATYRRADTSRKAY